ncbi:hypothetical protein R3P38DRAFT_2607245 [Favolaschia claudopus]|uniref:Uncharacterized protein n=1 Tax=Favolaschia claudopus TaxID=2862362 RepID=A0AAW0D6H5_9AGAR
MDPIHITLALCLLATNLHRLLQAVNWLSERLPAPQIPANWVALDPIRLTLLLCLLLSNSSHFVWLASYIARNAAINPVHLTLIICLILTNLPNLYRVLNWVLANISQPPNERLVPLYDREDGVKIFYGDDPQHWKRSAARYGYTKPSRHNAARRRKIKNDGRPPDTSKALMTKKSRPAEHAAVYEKSYKWRDNSCWLDCALTLISTAASRDYGQSMAPMFEALPANSPLRDLRQMVHTRTQGSIELLGYEDGGSDLLNNQRDGFRRQIRHVRGHQDRGLRSFSSVFGWLYAICGHHRRRGAVVDPLVERASAYFRSTVVSLKACTGNSSGFDHWQLSHVRARSEFQLSRTLCEKYAGNVRKWFQDLVRVTKSIPQSGCWQVDDGRPLCLHGNVVMHEVLLNLPIVLIIEMGDMTECEWNIPASIIPYAGNAAASAAGVKYSIVGHWYGGEREQHFTARYLSTSGATKRIFDYNDMKHDGHAIQHSTKSLAGSLTGPSRSIKTGQGFQIYGLVYHLDGGEEAQKFFRKQQVKSAQKLGLQFHFDPSNDNGIPFRCEFIRPHTERMDDDSAWIRDPHLKNLEYISNLPRSPRKWHPPLAPKASTNAPSPPAPAEESDSHPFELPSPIDLRSETGDSDVDAAKEFSSQTTSSTTVCPVWCSGEGCEAYFVEGDDEYDEVQCLDCKWWSHIRCLPKGIDWHDPAVEFICRRCRFFEPDELVLFPPPDTPKLDDGSVQWYPARFLSRDRQQKGTDLEFEFVWLDCIQNAVAAGQAFSASRELCKAVYGLSEEPGKIKKSQLPKVRMPRYLDPNFAGHSNPELEAIFNSAIPSIVTILTDFSVHHPLVQHYINFATEAKKPKKRPKRGAFHITPTESSIAFDWQETIGLGSTPEQNALKARAIETLLKRFTLNPLDPDDKFSPAEWQMRVSSVGSALLQILAVQHELKEPLNLNGDILDDLLSQKIIAASFDGEVVLHLIMTCAMGQITNAATSVEKFAKFEREFTVYDETYRPPTFHRVADSTAKPSPPITVIVKRAAEDGIEGEPSSKRAKKKEETERPKPKPRARGKRSSRN